MACVAFLGCFLGSARSWWAEPFHTSTTSFAVAHATLNHGHPPLTLCFPLPAPPTQTCESTSCLVGPRRERVRMMAAAVDSPPQVRAWAGVGQGVVGMLG